MLKTHLSFGRSLKISQSTRAWRHRNFLLLLFSLAFLVGFQSAHNSQARPLARETSCSAQQIPTGPAKTGELPKTKPGSSPDSVENNLAVVRDALKAVHAHDSHTLEEALGVDLVSSNEDFADSSSTALVELGDLDGDGIPEFALKRMRPETKEVPGNSPEDNLGAWELFLLSWDGTGWHASLIQQGSLPFEISVISLLFAGSRQIALVVYVGTGEIPYPSIYRLKDHVASLLWDGRADDSDYQGYAHGKVEFRALDAGSAPQMLVSGRADPGLLHFPAGGHRGFDAQASYIWDGKSYTENKTEYSANEDRTLYLFISALHLHDFRSAYALIDPAKFLQTAEPSLDMFRKQIEGSWPEFLEDQVFEVPEEGSEPASPFQFERDEESKHYIYLPSFGTGLSKLLTGLVRREESGSDQ
jgi:hypothetical protein